MSLNFDSLRQYRRKGTAVTVTVLGLALLTVFLAYIAFGDTSDRSDPARVRYVAIVSLFNDSDLTISKLQ